MFVAISMQVLSSLDRYENKAAIAYAYGEERQHIVWAGIFHNVGCLEGFYAGLED